MFSLSFFTLFNNYIFKPGSGNRNRGLTEKTVGNEKSNRLSELIYEYYESRILFGICRYGEQLKSVPQIVFYPHIHELLAGTKTPQEVAEALEADCNAAIGAG